MPKQYLLRSLYLAVTFLLSPAITLAAEYLNQQPYPGALTGNKTTVILMEKAAHTINEQLDRAAVHGDVATVIDLIAKGADVNAQDESREPALLSAAATHFDKDKRPVMEALITHGADVNALSHRLPLLYWLMNRDNVIGTEILLDHGAHVNEKNFNGTTPLMWAFLSGKLAFIEPLLAHGANVEIKDDEGNTLLSMASQSGNKVVFDLLLAHGASITTRNNNEQTPLYRAAAYGQLDIVQSLIAHGADVKAIDHDGNTPLHAAAAIGSNEVVEALLSYGLDVNAQNNKRETPLRLAADNEQLPTVERLLRHGANVNLRDKRNDGLLDLAVYAGETELVELLLNHGANTDDRNRFHQTPLQWAVSHGDKENVNKLLAHGARVDVINDDGETVLDNAIARRYGEVRNILLAAGARKGDSPRRARRMPSVASVDCSKARTVLEKSICHDPEVLRLDRKLAQSYAGAMTKLSEEGRSSLREGQRRWLRFIAGVCGSYKESDDMIQCARRKYSDRLDDLKSAAISVGPYLFTQTDLFAYALDKEGNDLPSETHIAFPMIDGPLSKSVRKWNATMQSNSVKQSDDLGEDESVSFNVVFASDNLISSLSSDWTYGHGAAHGNGDSTIYNFILEPEFHEMTINDVFRSDKDWSAYLDDYCIEALIKRTKNNKNVDRQAIREALAGHFANPKEWLVQKDGLTMTFERHAMWDLGLDDDNLVVPWEKLRPFLTPSFPVPQ